MPRYSKKFEEKYRKLVDTVEGFDSLAWYKSRHVPKIIKNKKRYKAIADRLGIPLCIVPLIESKEMGSSVGKFDRYIGNGQKLTQKTTIVPKNRGPFNTWEEGVIDALITLKGYDKITEWTLERMLFEMERYNGFGYMNRGKESAYLWAKTLPHGRNTGKFVADGVYDPNAIPKNIGVYALYTLLVQADPDFKVDAKTPIKEEEPKETLSELIKELIIAVIDLLKGNKTKG